MFLPIVYNPVKVARYYISIGMRIFQFSQMLIGSHDKCCDVHVMMMDHDIVIMAVILL